MRKYKIGVFGSAGGAEIKKVKDKAHFLGIVLGKSGCVILSGAGSGLPNEVVSIAAKNGADVRGFSPAISKQTHKTIYPENDISIFNKLYYVPENFKFSGNLHIARQYRNLMSTATCDAGIIISGRWGTMHEFCGLYEFGKVIGVLAGTGGVADELPKLIKKFAKPSKAKIIFNSDPKKLVQLIIKELKKR